MELNAFIFGAVLIVIRQVGGQSLTGRQLKITTIHSPPLVIVNNATAARWKGTYQGILIDVISQLAAMANFTYTLALVGDQKYGSEVLPGVWNGMIGEVQNNVADIAIAPLTVTASRAKQVTYTQPIMDAGLRILYRKTHAPVSHQSLLILLSPFTFGLWFMIVACFAAASFVFFVIGKLSPYEELETSKVGENVPFTTTIVNTLFYSISSFLHQDMKSIPRSLSGRVMSVFWWIFTTLVLTTFAANFAAFLMSKSPDIRRLPFMNFDELSRQTTVKYGTIATGSTREYFKNSKRPMEQRLWKQMSSDPTAFSNNFAEGVKRVRTENYALISEGPMAKYFNNRYPCDLLVVGTPIEVRSYGFVCGKNSDVCGLLNPYILRLTQSHFITQTIRKWVSPGECSSFLNRVVKMRGNPVVDSFKKLGIRLETQMSFDRFSAAFFILLGGILLTLAVLGGEIFYVRKFGLPQK